MIKFSSLYFQIGFITLCSLTLFLLVFIINNDYSYEYSSFIKQQQQQQQQKVSLEGGKEKELKIFDQYNKKQNNKTPEEQTSKRYNFFKPAKLYSNELIDQLSLEFIFNENFEKKLLHLNNLIYLIEPFKGKAEVACATDNNSSGKNKTLIIFINSKWSNFNRRKELRDSWLNIDSIKASLCNYNLVLNNGAKLTRIKWFFTLGLSKEQYLTNRVDSKVIEESSLNGDILVMNLYERYRDMSTKHLSVYKWLLNEYYAPGAAGRDADDDDFNENSVIVLKSDDDNKINLNQLRKENLELILKQEQFERAKSGKSQASWLMCALFPEGTKTIRDNSKSKWALTFDEYPFETLPAYCSGLAYLMPLVLIKRLYVVAHLLQQQQQPLLQSNPPETIESAAPPPLQSIYERPLWIDDLYITGIVRSSLLNKVNIFNAINTYCFTKQQSNLKYHTILKDNECTFLDMEMYATNNEEEIKFNSNSKSKPKSM